MPRLSDVYCEGCVLIYCGRGEIAFTVLCLGLNHRRNILHFVNGVPDAIDWRYKISKVIDK